MRIATERLGGVTIVALYGDLDLESAEEVKQTLTGRIDEGATAIVLDLAGVPYIDSSGLGAVVCAMKRARASGADIHLCGLQAEVQSTLTITGLIKHVEVYADRDETLAALATASAAPGPRSSPGLVSASA